MTFYTDVEIKMLAKTARKMSEELDDQGFDYDVNLHGQIVLAVVKAQAEGMITNRVYRNAPSR